jgi:hypothetical protein
MRLSIRSHDEFILGGPFAIIRGNAIEVLERWSAGATEQRENKVDCVLTLDRKSGRFSVEGYG